MLDVNQMLTLFESTEQEAKHVLNLVPSESFSSILTKIPFLLDSYHRYFFNVAQNQDSWHFRGAQSLSKIETEVAIPLLKELSQASYVNLRPLSGMHAMLIVLSGLAKAGDSIFCLSSTQGGHYATRPNAERFGLRVTEINGPDAHTLDLGELKKNAHQLQPRLVYIDQCNGLFPFNIQEIVETTKAVSPNTLIHVDASHWLGLIFGGALANPLAQGADSFGGSTHKTFPGPHKGILATNNKEVDKAMQAAQYMMVSNHNFAAVMSLALCLLEFKQNGRAYAFNTVENSKILGASLENEGLNVLGKEKEYSAGHQLWVCTETSHPSLPAQMASERLYKANMRVNFLPDIPGLQKPGLRLGVAEATYRGLDRTHMKALGKLIAAAIRGQPTDPLKSELASLLKQASAPFSNLYSSEINKKLSKIFDICIA